MHNAISIYTHHYLLENRENGTKIALYSRRYVTTTRMYVSNIVGCTVQFGRLGHIFGLCHFCFINFKVPPDVRIPLGHLVKKAAKIKLLFGEMSERVFFGSI